MRSIHTIHSKIGFYAEGEKSDDGPVFEEDDASNALDILRNFTAHYIDLHLLEDFDSFNIEYKSRSYPGMRGLRDFLAKHGSYSRVCGEAYRLEFEPRQIGGRPGIDVPVPLRRCAQVSLRQTD